MSYSLYLYSKSTPAPQTRTRVIEWLKDNEIIGSQQAEPAFPATEHLMEWITYLGCSPILAAGDVNASITLHCFETVTGLGGESVVSIRYPGCKHVVANAANLIKGASVNKPWECPECGNSGTVDQINWRKSAGFSQCFIEISGIFPKEALPSDIFLSSLKTLSKSDWLWFYSKSSAELLL